MSFYTSRIFRTFFPPPLYLKMPTAGIDISTSGVKCILLKEESGGLVIDAFGLHRFKKGVMNDGDLLEKEVLIQVLKELKGAHDITFANIALPEQKAYLFETQVNAGLPVEERRKEMLASVTQEVPLSAEHLRFDTSVLSTQGGKERVAGVAYARRIVAEYRDAVRASGIAIRAMESEMHAVARALLPHGARGAALIVDIGKTATKLTVVQDGAHPLFSTSLDIGGNALTEAVKKYFEVSEEEAKRIKREKGIISDEVGDEYLTSVLTTLSAMREEIARRFEYWQNRAKKEEGLKPIERVVLTGGNANLRGLPEYFAASLGVPVKMGNPFTNLAPFSEAVPPIEYEQSHAYTTAIGLALRDILTNPYD